MLCCVFQLQSLADTGTQHILCRLPLLDDHLFVTLAALHCHLLPSLIRVTEWELKFIVVVANVMSHVCSSIAEHQWLLKCAHLIVLPLLLLLYTKNTNIILCNVEEVVEEWEANDFSRVTFTLAKKTENRFNRLVGERVCVCDTGTNRH